MPTAVEATYEITLVYESWKAKLYYWN